MRKTALAPLGLALIACGGGPSISIDPHEGPASGYFALTIELAESGVDASSVTSLQVAENRAYDLVVEGDTLTAMVQGSESAEPAVVEIAAGADLHTYPGAFDYLPPRDERFRTVCAMGASLSQGVQNGVPSHHGAIMSPPAQVARQLGGYFPLPLLHHDFMPQIGPADIGPPPACAVPDIVAFVAASAVQVLKQLNGDFANARIDPDLGIRNVAVGGSKIRDVLRGPDPENFAANFVSHLVFDPHGTGPVEVSQLELCESLAPTLVLISDLYYNDVAASLLGGDVIDASLITPQAELEADLAELLDRLEATGAHVFVTNMPRPSILPASREKKNVMVANARAAAIEAGTDPDAAAEEATALADEAIELTDAAARAFNDVLQAEAQARTRIYVVDAETAVEAAALEGLSVGGQILTTQKFGGLLGLDGVHFTDTGYAYFANVFIDTINAALGTSVPRVDVERVFAADPGSPPAVAAGGLDVSACDR